MKRNLTIAFCVIVTLTATSCKKSWNCICSQDGNNVTVATYQNTNIVSAKSQCDAKQADVRALFPNATCNIK